MKFISLNIGPRILNPNTLEYSFPLAGHIYSFSLVCFLDQLQTTYHLTMAIELSVARLQKWGFHFL